MTPENRLLSLDFFRGFTMFILVAEFTHLFEWLTHPKLAGTALHFIGTQLHHHPWNGLHAWDLVQPFFMLIVGVAMPLSFSKRMEKGADYKDLRRHAIRRAFILLALGWGIMCIALGRLALRFQNVLAQLSVAYLLSFLLLPRSPAVQIAASFGLIVFSEACYRLWPVAGFNQPFTPGKNFGSWVDLNLFGEVSKQHWASFNAITTTAHTIWGVVAGQLLMSERDQRDKLKWLVLSGVLLVALGYGLSPWTPIIKRAMTSTCTMATGGMTLLALALSYWVIDVLKIRRWAVFFAIVGVNPLAIYLLSHVGGPAVLNHVGTPFVAAAFSWAGKLAVKIITCCFSWAMQWYICYWLNKKKIYITI